MVNCRTRLISIFDVAEQSVLIVGADEELTERKRLLGKVGVQLDVVD